VKLEEKKNIQNFANNSQHNVNYLFGAGFVSTSRIAGSFGANAKFGTCVRNEGGLFGLFEAAAVVDAVVDAGDIGLLGVIASGLIGMGSSNGTGEWMREVERKVCMSESKKLYEYYPKPN
jgi:hypothetical protein